MRSSLRPGRWLGRPAWGVRQRMSARAPQSARHPAHNPARNHGFDLATTNYAARLQYKLMMAEAEPFAQHGNTVRYNAEAALAQTFLRLATRTDANWSSADFRNGFNQGTRSARAGAIIDGVLDTLGMARPAAKRPRIPSSTFRVVGALRKFHQLAEDMVVHGLRANSRYETVVSLKTASDQGSTPW